MALKKCTDRHNVNVSVKPRSNLKRENPASLSSARTRESMKPSTRNCGGGLIIIIVKNIYYYYIIIINNNNNIINNNNNNNNIFLID